MDLGHYERFIDEDLNKYSNLTSGKIFWNVLNKERKGEYLGETVQIIPHITNEIKSFIYRVGKKTNADVVITEIGGTIGDIEHIYIGSYKADFIRGRQEQLLIRSCNTGTLSCKFRRI